MSDWRDRRSVALIVMVVVLTIQLAIPVSRLGNDDALRFGWKMFSEAGKSLDLVVTTSEGDRLEIELKDYMALVRADMDIAALLPPHLCSVVPDAKTVSWNGGSLEC